MVFLVEGELLGASLAPRPEIPRSVRTICALLPKHIVQYRIAVLEFDGCALDDRQHVWNERQFLLIHFRSMRAAILTTLPMVAGILVLLAAARLVDYRLNLVNLIAVPMLVGVDVDYGIFLVSLAASKQGFTRRTLATAAAASVWPSPGRCTAAGRGSSSGASRRHVIAIRRWPMRFRSSSFRRKGRRRRLGDPLT